MSHGRGSAPSWTRPGAAGFPAPSGRRELYSRTLAAWGWPEYAVPTYLGSHVHRTRPAERYAPDRTRRPDWLLCPLKPSGEVYHLPEPVLVG